MIRNGNKIFGEANDPNTVLANGELKANQYVVGAGNKGVKQYDAGTKKLMITDIYGNVSSISYNVPNKCVGTDLNGNIVMREVPTGGTNMRFGSEQSPITNFTVNNPNVVLETGTDEGCVTAVLSKLTDSTTPDTFTFEFETPISFVQETECKVCIQVSLEGILLHKLKLLNNFNEEIVLNPNNSACSKTVKIPAGTYNKITVVEEQPSAGYNNRVLVLSCLINY